MNDNFYNKETIDAKLEAIHDDVKATKKQVEYTNGKVRRHEKILLVVGTAILVLLFTNGSSLLEFVKVLAGI